MSSGDMEATETTNKKQLASPTYNSGSSESESTLAPKCSKSPKGYTDNNAMLEGIDDVRKDQPCSEVDGSTTFKLPKKTHQDFFEKLMVQVENKQIDAAANTMSTVKELPGPTDSNENITGGLESEGVPIYTKVNMNSICADAERLS